MMTSPLVSIIIPTYNQADFLQECLRSVIDQSYSFWEAIVVNNFSDDHTLDIVRKFEDERIHVLNFANQGVIAASRNRGVNQAKGSLIAFLDSDDVWHKDKLQCCVDAFFNNEVDIICTDVLLFDNKGYKRHYYAPKKFSYLRILFSTNKIVTSSVVIKRDVFIQEKGFNEHVDIITCEDYDLWLRLAYKKNIFLSIHRILTYYRLNETGASKNCEKHLKANLNVLKKHKEQYMKISFINRIRIRWRMGIAVRAAGIASFKAGKRARALQYFLLVIKYNFF